MSAPGSAGPRDDGPVVPDRSEDDDDRGWGPDPGSGGDDERFTRERPPHW